MDEAEVNILNTLKDPNASDSDKRGLLVEEILSRLEIRSLADTGELVYYEDGVFRSGGKDRILMLLQELGRYDVSNHMRAEVVETIRVKTISDRNKFDSDPHWLHCANGWVNVHTGEFKEHSPEMPSLHKIPVPYKAGAVCPEICRFLESTLDPESMAAVLRMIAYCLLRSSKYEKAFMLVGEGANGKSTLINVIKALLGSENCSSVSLQEIASNRFAAAELQGKMVNLHPDLKADKVKDGGYFKALVSGDRIKVERKYSQPFNLENTAKTIFSANEIPETDDDSYSYFRRWVIIPFNRTFEGYNRDTQLLAKLTTEEELSGLLYWALICLQLLEQENGFQDTDIEDIRRQYQLGASKIEDFIKECCELGDDEKVRTAEFNSALSQYCRAKGSNYLDIREVGRKMAALSIENKLVRVKGERAHFYVGIGLKGSVTMSQMNDHIPVLIGESVVERGSGDPIVTTVTAEGSS
jgi:putative DNA primase/helicase